MGKYEELEREHQKKCKTGINEDITHLTLLRKKKKTGQDSIFLEANRKVLEESLQEEKETGKMWKKRAEERYGCINLGEGFIF